ncbi:MAG: prepilin peptidase [Vibrionaceae bacterium]|nr:prepilin peptidase [Vibrionaceae bacterium]
MVTNLALWAILLMIGVSDAQRHRIPNQLVIALMLCVCVDVYMQADVEWWFHIKGFLLTFAACFCLYLMRVMAGGDVKLLAVVAFWLGATEMWQAVPYMIIAGGVTGLFYLALYLASTSEPISIQVKVYAVQKMTRGWRSKQPLVIPFAPSIVIGLAYYFYIH